MSSRHLIDSVKILRKHLFPTALAIFVLAAASLASCGGQALNPSIAKTKMGYVRLNEPVVVTFNQKVDPKSVKPSLAPKAAFTLVTQAKKALLSEKQPSGEFVTPEELGALAVFFCSPAADQVRGVAWNMDGGWAAQ